MIKATEIERAAARIFDVPAALVRTPTVKNPVLCELTGGTVYLKCEHLQTGGSFKLRGAMNKMRVIAANDPDSRQVIAASSGNHGIAVAMAAQATKLGATIYLPGYVAKTKLASIERLGAKAVKVDGDALLAEQTARKAATEQSIPYLSPYNDHDIVAGQGTMGLEIVQDCPKVDEVLVAVGGGGMASGIGVAVKAARPGAKITGVWPEGARSMHACLEAGKIVEVSESETLSDGTAGGVEEGAVTLEYLQSLMTDTHLVSERDIRRAMRWLLDHEHWVVEGSGALPLAAMLAEPEAFADQTTVVVLCGRNIDSARYLEAVTEADSG